MPIPLSLRPKALSDLYPPPLPDWKLTETELQNYAETIGDKLWRLTHLYKIRTKDQELITFYPNNIQWSIIANCANRPLIRDFFLKYRQGGVSTLWLLWWMDEVLFKRNVVTAILADKWQNLTKLWRIIEIAYEYLPEQFKPKLVAESGTRYQIAGTNSEIFIGLSVRAIGIHNLHVSEACYIEKEELTATFGATSREQTNITCESTANGIGNFGHDLYQDAKLGKNGFRPFFYPWFIQNEYRINLNGMPPLELTNDERKLAVQAKNHWNVDIVPEQILWRRETKRTFGDRFMQDYPENDEEAFLTTGNKFFNGRKLLALLSEARSAANGGAEIERGEFHIMWEKPSKACLYVAGADTAEGVGADYSVLKILCVSCRQEAFMIRGHFSVDRFYELCDEWCRRYYKCILAVERNNHGHAVIQGLAKICNYPNLYSENAMTRVLAKEFAEPRYGWATDIKSKTLMLDQLKAGIEGDPQEDENTFQPDFSVVDQQFLEEALTFSQQGVKLMAEPGKHDDIVIATAIAYQMYARERGQMIRRRDHGIIVGGPREAVS